jgi:negative regulator of flagellin synthesis FlgM
MRVEAYAQVQQIYKTQKAGRPQVARGVSQTSDMLSISSFGKDIQTAKAALAGTPDIREELTAPIKAKIQNGSYSVSNESFADKLMRKLEEVG